MCGRIAAIPLALVALALAALVSGVLAENIDPNNDSSQYAWSENAGWVNAEPNNCSGCGVQVGSPAVTGWMWGENIGWINMSCRNNYGASCTGSPGGTWGVTNDGAGNLAGYAWGENAGWISFSCQNNPGTCASTGNYGVSIGPITGVFMGQAWGENIGWITFSDTAPVAYQVQTSDADGDGIDGSIEITCGSDPGNSGLRPERIDGVFAGVDDDGDTLVDEPLPAGAANVDCDGDGWSGSRESGTPLCGNGINDDGLGGVSDDGVVDDGCPGGPAQVGAYSEAQFNIGLTDQDPCGNNGWPGELQSGGFSANRITLADVTSFTTPPTARKFGTSPGNAAFNSRWDLIPGGGPTWINLADITSLTAGLAGSPARPPMLGGVRAFGGPTCPWPP